MAFKLVISDTVRVSVKGELAGEDGQRRPFGFDLVMKRLSERDISPAAKDDERTVAEFLAEQAQDWEGVLGDDDRPMAFSAKAFDQLMSVAGLPHLILQAYVETCGARGRAKK